MLGLPRMFFRPKTQAAAHNLNIVRMFRAQGKPLAHTEDSRRKHTFEVISRFHLVYGQTPGISEIGASYKPTELY